MLGCVYVLVLFVFFKLEAMTLDQNSFARFSLIQNPKSMHNGIRRNEEQISRVRQNSTCVTISILV